MLVGKSYFILGKCLLFIQFAYSLCPIKNNKVIKKKPGMCRQ